MLRHFTIYVFFIWTELLKCLGKQVIYPVQSAKYDVVTSML